jgi:DNA polymerase III epsilon subunit-like protein
MPIILVYDTETTGKPPTLPGKKFAEGFFSDKKLKAEQWPRIVQLAFILYDTDRMETLQMYDSIIQLRPNQYPIPAESTKVHGITDEKSQAEGIPIAQALVDFMEAYERAAYVVGHNIQYDINVVLAEIVLMNRRMDDLDREFLTKEARKALKSFQSKMAYDPDSQFKYCTLQNGKARCNLPKLQYDDDGPILGEDGEPLIDYTLDKEGKRKIRGPSLENSHKLIFHEKPNGQLHNALVDVAVSLRIYMMLRASKNICSAEHMTESNDAICALINPTPISKAEMPKTIADELEMVDILPVEKSNALEMSLHTPAEASAPAQTTRRSSRLNSSPRLTIGEEATLLGEAASVFENMDSAVAKGISTRSKTKKTKTTNKSNSKRMKSKKTKATRKKQNNKSK